MGTVAQSDARQTGDQEVAVSNPSGCFRVEMLMIYFLRSFSPYADSKRAVKPKHNQLAHF